MAERKQRTTAIRWEEPPPRATRHGKGVWVRRMEPLKERPNQWALIKECPSRQTAATTAARLRKRDADGNRFAELPDGEFEITARDNRIYARYLDGDATPF